MVITQYCVRHLPTKYNIDELITGNNDPPVLPGSLEDAKKMAPIIQSWGINRILSGTSLRQKQTAQPIAALTGIGVEYDERMNERGEGRFQGVKYREVDTEGLSIQIYLALKEDCDDDSNPNIPKTDDPGERKIAMRKRIRKFLDEKIWYPTVPDNDKSLLIVSEVWYYYFLNELFGNHSFPIGGVSSLENGFYAEYIIYNPIDPKRRVVRQARANVRIQ